MSHDSSPARRGDERAPDGVPSDPRGRKPRERTAGSQRAHDGAVPGADPRFERRARFWMRAYPPRWRAARGEEMLWLLADLAEPGADRLTAREAVDVARGGWATRWREHPPLLRWLAYRALDVRIPRAYRAWAEDDIAGFWHPMRRYLWQVAFLVVFVVVLSAFQQIGWDVSALAALLVGLAVGSMVLWPDYHRRQARLKHVALRAGEPLEPGAFVTREVRRERASARSGALWASLLMAAVALSSLVAALMAPLITYVIPIRGGFETVTGPMAGHRATGLLILAVATLLGLLGALVGVRRLHRLWPETPQQPHRTVRPVTVPGRLGLAFCAALVGGIAFLESAGRLVLGVSVALGAVALLMLPGAVVAVVVLRRVPHAPDLAGNDLWAIMARGVAPAVDWPAEQVAPYEGPVPDGAVLPPRRPVEPPYPAHP